MLGQKRYKPNHITVYHPGSLISIRSRVSRPRSRRITGTLNDCVGCALRGGSGDVAVYGSLNAPVGWALLVRERLDINR